MTPSILAPPLGFIQVNGIASWTAQGEQRADPGSAAWEGDEDQGVSLTWAFAMTSAMRRSPQNADE
jgi:hypothetical protein